MLSTTAHAVVGRALNQVIHCFERLHVFLQACIVACLASLGTLQVCIAVHPWIWGSRPRQIPPYKPAHTTVMHGESVVHVNKWGVPQISHENSSLVSNNTPQTPLVSPFHRGHSESLRRPHFSSSAPVERMKKPPVPQFYRSHSEPLRLPALNRSASASVMQNSAPPVPHRHGRSLVQNSAPPVPPGSPAPHRHGRSAPLQQPHFSRTAPVQRKKMVPTPQFYRSHSEPQH